MRPTLRHLATHRGGSAQDPPNRRDRPHSPSVMEPYSIAELYRGLAMTTLTSRPGTRCAVFQLRIWGCWVMCWSVRLVNRMRRSCTSKPLTPRRGRHEDQPLTAGDLERFAAHYWPKESGKSASAGSSAKVCAFAGPGPNRPRTWPGASWRGTWGQKLASGGGQGYAAPRCWRQWLSNGRPVGTDKKRWHTWAGSSTDHPKLGQILSHNGEADGHSSAM